MGRANQDRQKHARWHPDHWKARVALSSAEAELYAMVAASAETLATMAYAKDLGVAMGGEVFTDSSAVLGIS